MVKWEDLSESNNIWKGSKTEDKRKLNEKSKTV